MRACFGLLKSPDPYILDGDPGRELDWWTSIDMRVFQVTEGGRRSVRPSRPADAGAATTFIQSVITNLNNPPTRARRRLRHDRSA